MWADKVATCAVPEAELEPRWERSSTGASMLLVAASGVAIVERIAGGRGTWRLHLSGEEPTTHGSREAAQGFAEERLLR